MPFYDPVIHLEMKIRFLQILVCVVLNSCSQPTIYKGPVVDPDNIVKDIMSWLNYERAYMRWSGDYIAIDSAKNPMVKKVFLEQLITGEYFPVKISTRDSSVCYQLYKLDKSTSKEIGEIIRNKALIEYGYYKMEGKPLPLFDFVDLDGNEYNVNTTNGKLLLIKCWFIRCKPCVAEMPKLNQLVSQFENKKDVLFVSLAFDQAKELKTFLEKTAFKYKVVPGKEKYLMDDLNINLYPTHLLIGRNGRIMKVSNDLDQIISIFKKESQSL